MRLSTSRRGGAPVRAAHDRVRMSSDSSPLVIQEQAATGAPLSNTDCRPAADAVATSNGAQLQTRLVRVGTQSQWKLAQPLADPGLPPLRA